MNRSIVTLRRTMWALFAIAQMWISGAVAQESRVALVVGNGAYREGGALPNAVNDARLIGEALSRIGFEVEALADMTRDGMLEALRRFHRRAASADVALFFYAGHGMQAYDSNYLLPVDARPDRQADLRLDAIDIETVMAQVDSARLRIVILDACRDNPFAMKIAARTRSMTRGLARIEAPPAGAAIVFSTAPGQVAADGNGANSPFAAALAEHMTAPGIEFQQMMRRVRADVRQATGGKQTPWENSSLTSEFYLVSAPREDLPARRPATRSTGPVAPPIPASVDPATAHGPASMAAAQSIELAFWQSAERGNTAADYEAYLSHYPNGIFRPLAEARLNGLRALPSAPARAPSRTATPPSDRDAGGRAGFDRAIDIRPPPR